MKELISVIVPVYNTPNDMLSECIHSILIQSWPSIEILLIDDGSTEAVANACDVLSESNDQVSVIHIPNSGVSIARNTGLDACSGEYITFVDSDDRLLPGFFSDAMCEIRRLKLDAIRGAYVLDDGKTRKCDGDLSPYKGETIVVEDDSINSVSEYFCAGVYFEGPEWLKHVSSGGCATVFSKGTIGSMRFPEGLRIHEDSLFMSQVFEQSTRIGLCFRPWYLYQRHESSASHSSSSFIDGELLHDFLLQCSAVQRKPFISDICISTRLMLFVSNTLRIHGLEGVKVIEHELEQQYAREALARLDIEALPLPRIQKLKLFLMQKRAYKLMSVLVLTKNLRGWRID